MKGTAQFQQKQVAGKMLAKMLKNWWICGGFWKICPVSDMNFQKCLNDLLMKRFAIMNVDVLEGFWSQITKIDVCKWVWINIRR